MKKSTRQGIVGGIFLSISFAIFFLVTSTILYVVFTGIWSPLDPTWMAIYLTIFGGLISGIASGLLLLKLQELANINENSQNDSPKPDEEKKEVRSPLMNGLNKDDIDRFCKEVIFWKVSASEKDEMFKLFKENPYYLIGYLTFITQKNIKQTKILQKNTVVFTVVMAILATGSMAIAIYAIKPEFYLYAMIIGIIVVFAILYVMNKYQPITE